MASQNIIPRRLCKASIPACSACKYGKATRRPWRGKSTKHGEGGKPKAKLQPGDVVAMDQLVSSTPGLIAQMTGFVTSKRYNDMASQWTFVYLQQKATAEATLQSKRAFEAQAAQRGLSTKAYHADNGIFKAKEWVKACSDAEQPLTFAGDGALHAHPCYEKMS